jgi:hypothetical protein
MRRLSRLFLAAGVAAIALPAAAGTAPTTDDPILMRGIGPLRIGLTAAALERRFAARPVDRDFEAENDCGYWTSPRLPGLALMVVEGRLARIDVTDPGWRTRSGARVGMDQQQMLDLYGGLMRVEPHPYTDPEGKYLVYRARREPFGLIAETSAGKVQSIRVGYWKNVEWIEGCL